MEQYEIDHQMAVDAGLCREEIVAGLIADITGRDNGHRAAVRCAARKRRLATEFGSERGWKLTRTAFGLAALMRGTIHGWVKHPITGAVSYELPFEFFDHPYWYRKDKRAVAIASHLYAFDSRIMSDKLDAFTSQHGLQWETPDFPSWWFPGQSTLVVFTRAP